jgi:hypothetical protein
MVLTNHEIEIGERRQSPDRTKLPAQPAHLTSVTFSFVNSGGPPLQTTEVQERELQPTGKTPSLRFWEAQRFLTVGSLGLAVAQGVCAAAVLLSGAGSLLGFSSLIAASAAGPATGLHANRLRIPMLTAAGVGAMVNLVLLWNAERIRRNPSARWRMRPLTRKQLVEKWIQLSASMFTLLLIAAELITHPLFHHEL